jgi:hypothetical protein
MVPINTSASPEVAAQETGSIDRGVAYVDGHVHVYDCFNRAALLDAGYANIARAAAARGDTAFEAVLIVVSTAREPSLADLAATGSAGRWRFEATDDRPAPLALRAIADDSTLTLISGCQVVAAEGIEVLGLCMAPGIADGLPIGETIAAVVDADGIPVLPWGAGKWLGKRARVVGRLVESEDRIYLADNGGRPAVWRLPSFVGRDAPLLSGTDPLPLLGREGLVGTAGFVLGAGLDPAAPATSIRDAIRGGRAPIRPYGSPRRLAGFVRDQVGLRL